MRSHFEYAEVRRLADEGLNDCAIARRTGIPRSTVRGWRRDGAPGRAWRRHRDDSACPGCGLDPHDFDALPSEAYAYLLGQYLGDGHIVAMRRTHRFGIYTDNRHPHMHAEIAAAVATIVPGPTVGISPQRGCVRIGSYSRQWPCLFPQHGPGPKHRRAIQLTDWQIAHCERHPGQLLRGLIHSDGSRFINRVRSPAGRTYEYPRYVFNNKSDDILLIFGAACERVGVAYTWCRDDMLAVSRRADVALLDTFIGPKA